jgi:hypothetical protein
MEAGRLGWEDDYSEACCSEGEMAILTSWHVHRAYRGWVEGLVGSFGLGGLQKRPIHWFRPWLVLSSIWGKVLGG